MTGSELERREIDNVRAGRAARIVFKMNALGDAAFTALLHGWSRNELSGTEGVHARLLALAGGS